MKSLLLSGKVKPDVGGQVLDIYNQSVMQGISPYHQDNHRYVKHDIRNNHEQRNHPYRSKRKEILYPNQEVHS